MALPSGARLGPYEILSALGAGGMGEVYRARDTRLDRTVAIKVLPPEFSADPDRLARFEREAKTIAALNHAHICTLHDIAEDIPSGPLPLASGPLPLSPVHYLVMELVEGETLAERIARPAVACGAEAPGLLLDEALSVATQVAGALEYAHARGIIHRDLKPANIMLTAGGAVKVLDFGLAKSAVLASAGPASEQATLAPDPTIAGAVLGTPHYMSPEQARGEPVDARADVWAFGCVLYEMLAGRRAFDGRTATDVLAAVIKDEPGWAALPPSTPQDVRGLLHRCLEKDAGERPAGMAAVSGALAAFATGAPESGGAPATRAATSSPAWAVAATRRRRQVTAAALIVATLALVAAGLWYFASGKSSGPSITSIAVLPLTNVSGNPDDQVLRRRDDRRADRQPGEHRGAEGDLAHLRHGVSGQQEAPARGCPGTEGGCHR